MTENEPSYIALSRSNELDKRIEILNQMLSSCKLCPRECGVDRTIGEEGICKSGTKLMVSGIHPHFGEEAPLVGAHGSGTIFLTGCNLRCVYCQNYEISHLGIGEVITIEEIAKNMLRLQGIGCHNINFVTPTHFVPQLVEAIAIAVKDGLNIPIVYNCGGYEKVEIVRLLDGIIDIYMPDMKYGRPKHADKYSKAKNYPEINFKAVKEMHRQVGDLKLDDLGMAYRGLLVRHLVLPEDLAGSERIFRFLADNVSKKTYINIMDQYRPQYKAWEFTKLGRKPTNKEYNRAVELAKKVGLNRGVRYKADMTGCSICR